MYILIMTLAIINKFKNSWNVLTTSRLFSHSEAFTKTPASSTRILRIQAKSHDQQDCFKITTYIQIYYSFKAVGFLPIKIIEPIYQRSTGVVSSFPYLPATIDLSNKSLQHSAVWFMSLDAFINWRETISLYFMSNLGINMQIPNCA